MLPYTTKNLQEKIYISHHRKGFTIKEELLPGRAPRASIPTLAFPAVELSTFLTRIMSRPWVIMETDSGERGFLEPLFMRSRNRTGKLSVAADSAA